MREILQKALPQILVNLDAWARDMRQEQGYGGPVAHWWQNRYQYTGVGLDWRYEGVLTGYSKLVAKFPDESWSKKLSRAAQDLIKGQCESGSYLGSRFEMNPDILGTPHEAAASLGLLKAIPYLKDQEEALDTARKNLDNLIDVFWDKEKGGFNDDPNYRGRVPIN